MRKKTIGEVLRLARVAHGLSLEQLQRLTHIQSRYLLAIEENDFEAIGDEEHVRLFLQRYAEIVDLDARVLLDAYQKNSLIVYYDTEENVEGSLATRNTRKSTSKKQSFLPLFYLLLVATAILIFVVYIVSTRIQNQARPQAEPSYSVVSKMSSSSVLPQESTSSQTLETSSSSEVDGGELKLTTTGTDPNLSVVITGASKPVEIVLSVTDATSWVSLTDTELAGGTTLSPTNQTVTVTIPEGVTYTTLTLGVVKGVHIKINGQSLDTSLLTSQTGYITFTVE